MSNRFLIMPAADLFRFDKIKFAIAGKPSKAPNDVRWEIRPVPLKDRTEFGIPENCLTHPAFKALKGILQLYSTEVLERSDLDIPEIP